MSITPKKDTASFAAVSALSINTTGGGNVTSVFGRTGAVSAQNGDYNVAQITGAAPIDSPSFTGNPTAPTLPLTDDSTSLATTAFIQNLTKDGLLYRGALGGGVDLNTITIPGVYCQPANSGAISGANYPPNQLAGCLVVMDNVGSISGLKEQVYYEYISLPFIDNKSGKVAVRAGFTTGWRDWRYIAYEDSPTFTGNPTAPTQALGDNTTNLATTEFVNNNSSVQTPFTPAAGTIIVGDTFKEAFAKTQGNVDNFQIAINNLQLINPVTVGSTGATFLTLNDAYNAGYRSFLVISNITQTNFTFSENVKIKINTNVTVAFTPTSANIIRSTAVSGNVILNIEGEEGSKITSTSNISGSSFISNTSTATLSILFAGYVTFDFSASTIRLDVINSNAKILNILQQGVLKVQTPTNLSCGFVLNQITISGFFYADYLIFDGLGTTAGFLVLTNLNAVNINKVELTGSFGATSIYKLLNLTNCQSVINTIAYKPTIAQNCMLEISGQVNNISNISGGNIDVLIKSNNTFVNYSNLGGGVLDINNQAGFKGYGISNYTATNLADDTLINSNFAISSTPTPASILSREPKLYLGGTNGEVYQFLGNASAQPVLINTPPFRFSLSKTFTPSVTVNNGTSYNLFTTVTAGDVTGGATTNMEYIPTKFAFQNTNLAVLFPPFRNYTDYKIRVQLQGTIAGAPGSDRQFSLELRRGADNSLILEDYIVKINDNDLTGLTRLYTSFVNGLADPFITGGLRIVLNNNSGASITLTGFALLIQGVSTNFIQ